MANILASFSTCSVYVSHDQLDTWACCTHAPGFDWLGVLGGCFGGVHLHVAVPEVVWSFHARVHRVLMTPRANSSAGVASDAKPSFTSILFPTVYFIEKYNLVLFHDTFRLELD